MSPSTLQKHALYTPTQLAADALFTHDMDVSYMHQALDCASKAARAGEVPIGALVVYWPHDPATRKPTTAEPRVIARAYNLREHAFDPTAHAELIAVRRAARALGTWRLYGCRVYVTLEPCVMCAGMLAQARVDGCVYGAADARAGGLGSLYTINSDARLNHRYIVHAGVCRDDCTDLLQAFFKARRGKHADSTTDTAHNTTQ